ncbi:MAG: 1-(5-phosphoribosyl)-5-[(5-phosphoribosylamino)methylideneamino]imidazole-4-carboxamide isomerase [Gammaproteobacteria bacterium]
MNIIPSIDIIDGKCVRLMQGDYEKVSVYGNAPADMAKRFRDAGATVLHVVDLEGAKNGKMTQLETIAGIVNAFGGIVQVGGGIRNAADMDRLFLMGVSRAVIGTRAVQGASDEWITAYGPEKVVLALDFNMIDNTPRIAVSGWTQDTTQTVWSMIEQWKDLTHILCTDIGRDGMQQGPSISFYAELVRRYPHIALQASGGVGSVEDVKTLAMLGVKGAVIGKAIYENKISLQEAIQCLK